LTDDFCSDLTDDLDDDLCSDLNDDSDLIDDFKEDLGSDLAEDFKEDLCSDLNDDSDLIDDFKEDLGSDLAEDFKEDLCSDLTDDFKEDLIEDFGFILFFFSSKYKHLLFSHLHTSGTSKHVFCFLVLHLTVNLMGTF
jgi:hypothetical protein